MTATTAGSDPNQEIVENTRLCVRGQNRRPGVAEAIAVLARIPPREGGAHENVHPKRLCDRGSLRQPTVLETPNVGLINMHVLASS